MTFLQLSELCVHTVYLKSYQLEIRNKLQILSAFLKKFTIDSNHNRRGVYDSCQKGVTDLYPKKTKCFQIHMGL